MRHSKWAATRAVFPAAVATAVRASLATDRPTTAYIQPVVRTALSDARSIELENDSIRYDAIRKEDRDSTETTTKKWCNDATALTGYATTMMIRQYIVCD